MTGHPLHLNLLVQQEGQPTPPTLSRILLPTGAALALLAVIGWGIVAALQLAVARSGCSRARAEIAQHKAESVAAETLKAKCRTIQAELTQYGYYLNGRRPRAGLLKSLASAIPPSVTLTSLQIPPQPEQQLRPPPGILRPPLQGTTQKVERVELRLTGLAADEGGVFRMMDNLKGSSFTNYLAKTEGAGSSRENPRVLAFRQEEARVGEKKRGVFFDIAYDIEPREFVK